MLLGPSHTVERGPDFLIIDSLYYLKERQLELDDEHSLQERQEQDKLHTTHTKNNRGEGRALPWPMRRASDLSVGDS